MTKEVALDGHKIHPYWKEVATKEVGLDGHKTRPYWIGALKKPALFYTTW